MRECYGSSSSSSSSSPTVGQLAAVLAEEEEEVLRAQVCEVMGDKVKVRFKGQLSPAEPTVYHLAIRSSWMSSGFCLK